MKHTRLVSLAVAVAAAFVLMVPGQAFAVRKLALSSGSFKFSAGAGETVDGSIVVINDGDEPIKVLVYSADQNIDAKGAVGYTVPSRSDLQATDLPSAWMRVFMPENSKSVGNIPFLEMAPKQRIPIKFSVKVPGDVPPGDHNVMLFFEMFSGESISAGAGTEVSGRIGTRVQLRVKGDLVERLEVSKFAVPAFVVGEGVPAVFTVRNLGNVDQRVVASLRLLDRNDETLTELKPINGRFVFAAQNLEASGTLMTSQPLVGPFTARLEVVPVNDEGQAIGSGKNTVIEKRTLWVVPAWVPAAAGAFLVLFVLTLVWRLGRRFGMRKRDAGSTQTGQPEQPQADSAGDGEQRSA